MYKIPIDNVAGAQSHLYCLPPIFIFSFRLLSLSRFLSCSFVHRHRCLYAIYLTVDGTTRTRQRRHAEKKLSKFAENFSEKKHEKFVFIYFGRTFLLSLALLRSRFSLLCIFFSSSSLPSHFLSRSCLRHFVILFSLKFRLVDASVPSRRQYEKKSIYYYIFVVIPMKLVKGSDECPRSTDTMNGLVE